MDSRFGSPGARWFRVSMLSERAASTPATVYDCCL